MPDSSEHPTLSHEQINLIASHTERAAKKALKKYSRAALLGFLLLLGGLILALSQTAGTSDLRAGLVSSCERVNILRAQSNNSDLVSFNILSLSAQRERELADTPAARQYGTFKTHLTSAKGLEAQAGKLTITGLTDCKKAVDTAKTYRFPVASPVGNPRTAKPSPEVVQIIKDSNALLEQYRKENA